LWGTLSGACALDAVMLGPGSGTCTIDAELYQPRWVWLDAAIAPRITGNFTLDAVVVALALADNFGRIYSPGLGRSWRWTDDDSWPSTSPDTALASVNGQEATLPPDGNRPSYESYTGLPDLQVGLVQFDIWIPANPNDGDNAFGFRFTNHSLYVMAGSSGNVLQLFMDWGTVTEVPVLASTWYTAKFWVDVTGQPWRGKLWERGTPEPDWQASGVVAASSVSATPYLDWYYSPAAEPGQIDNIFFWSAMPWTFYSVFTLDALIYQSGFTLDAQIYLMGGAFTLDAMVTSSVTDAPVWIDTTSAMKSWSNGLTVPESSQFVDGDIEILRISMNALGYFSWGWSMAWVGNPWQLLGFD
jgi:hypothetical protein